MSVSFSWSDACSRGQCAARDVPDLARFLMAHMNEGHAGEVQILEPTTAAWIHAPAVESSADIGMAASGYGWTLLREEPWSYWGYPFEMRGAQGHGGSPYGYRVRMFYVDEDEGGYGAIILSNVSDCFRQDMLWHLAIRLQIEDLLMEEAHELWSVRHGG